VNTVCALGSSIDGAKPVRVCNPTRLLRSTVTAHPPFPLQFASFTGSTSLMTLTLHPHPHIISSLHLPFPSTLLTPYSLLSLRSFINRNAYGFTAILTPKSNMISSLPPTQPNRTTERGRCEHIISTISALFSVRVCE
jgi:hypothetical protein